MTLYPAGTDAFGRPCVTAMCYWRDAFAAVYATVTADRPVSLVWNGIAAPVYVGQTPMEWWADWYMRLDAKLHGGWPKQIDVFMPEIDPFAITPEPGVEETPG